MTTDNDFIEYYGGFYRGMRILTNDKKPIMMWNPVIEQVYIEDDDDIYINGLIYTITYNTSHDTTTTNKLVISMTYNYELGNDISEIFFESDKALVRVDSRPIDDIKVYSTSQVNLKTTIEKYNPQFITFLIHNFWTRSTNYGAHLSGLGDPGYDSLIFNITCDNRYFVSGFVNILEFVTDGPNIFTIKQYDENNNIIYDYDSNI